MNKETWKDIKGFEGFYKISNYGNVFSLYSNIQLKKMITKGYYVVSLSKNNNIKKYKIHRLVAINFILNPNNRLYINHKNGDKLNNNVDNLEWVTASENTIHAYKNKLLKPLKGKNNPMFGMNGHKNPFYGKTHSNETIEKIKKINIGRHSGEKNKQAKLNNWDIKFIKEWLSLGYKQIDIAKAFNISKSVISNIKLRKIWQI